MMSMNKSSQWNRLRALAVVPVIALALLAFANPKSLAAVTANVQQDRTAQSEEQLPELVIVGMGLDKTADIEADSQADDVMTEEQAPEETAPQSKKVYESVEEMPQFPGGQEALMYFLQTNVKYPENAAKNNIQGRVLVQFVVNENGEVSDVTVARSVDEELDAEAIRVAKMLPKFEPGRINGKAVAVNYTLPISFKLQQNPNDKQ